MQPFELEQPTSVAEAVAALEAGGPDVRAVAGGTALVIMMKQRLFAPRRLVSLRQIPELRRIELAGDGSLSIGAAVCHEEVHQHPAVRTHFPLLAAAARRTANIRIRNVGTLGGNLAHADYQSDPPTALVALEAAVQLQGPAGTRRVALVDFFRGPYANAMQEDEIVVGVTIPAPPAGAKMAYLKFAPGSAGERPLVNLAAVVQLEDGVCRGIRLSVGAVSGRPERLAGVEEMLTGRTLDDAMITKAAAAAAEIVEPIDDIRGSAWYKRQMVRVVVQRALFQLRSSEGAEQK